MNEIDGNGKVVVLRNVGHASAAAADAAAAAKAALADAAAVGAALSRGGRGGEGGEGANGRPPASNTSFSSSLEGLLADLAALTSEEDAAKVRNFFESLTSTSPSAPSGGGSGEGGIGGRKSLVLSPSRDKASRGAVHAWFREAARALGAELASKGTLETTTAAAAAAASEGEIAPSSSSVCVVFTPGRGGSGRRGRGGGGPGNRNGNKRGREEKDAAVFHQISRQRPPLPGAFCHFTLEKTNLDTAAALQEIALRCWGGGGGGSGGGRGGRGGGRNRGRGSKNDGRRPVSSAALSVAGTKDKRGITCQRVSARRTAAKRLASAAAGVRGVRVGDFSYEAEGLRLGDGRGNRFTLALRGLRAEGGEEEGETETGGGGGGEEKSPSSSSALAAAAAASAFGAKGFLNYFGKQRFGVGGGAAPTHVVGALLARGEWEAAARAIMAPRSERGDGNGNGDAVSAAAERKDPPPSSHPHSHSQSRHEAEDAARRAWLRGDLDSLLALRALPRGAVAERAVLASLADAEEKEAMAGETRKPLSPLSAGARAARFSAALSRVPRNLRTMYIHALQSRLWNAAASARARESGPDEGVIEGDVILIEDSAEAEDGDDGGDDAADDAAAAADDDDDAAVAAAAANKDKDDDEEDHDDAKEKQQHEQQQQGSAAATTASKKRLPPAVRLAMAADAGLPISRVVLPMLAPGILLPTNSAGRALKEAARELAVDAGTCGATADKGKCGEATTRSHLGLAAAAGGYRKLVASPTRVRHLFVAHSKPDDDLPMSELFGEEEEDEEEGRGEDGGEKAGGKKKKKAKSSSSFSPSSPVELWSPRQPLPAGKRHVALLLRFRLPRSSYATMAVRELTKRPGSWDSGAAAATAGTAAAAAVKGEETREQATAGAVVSEEEAAAAAAAPVSPAAALTADPKIEGQGL